MRASELREARIALGHAIDRARAVGDEDRRLAESILETPAIRMARAVARCRCRQLATDADTEQIQAVATEAVWRSLSRIQLSMDTAQVIRFVEQRAGHAVSDAARDADPLPRRARTYRNRVLAAARAANLRPDEETLKRLAKVMYPQAKARTLELIVQGAAPMVDVHRVDVAAALVDERLDPVEYVVAGAARDAVHVTIADQVDPRFRAWAAEVLCDEHDSRRLPSAFARYAPGIRHGLLAWT